MSNSVTKLMTFKIPIVKRNIAKYKIESVNKTEGEQEPARFASVPTGINPQMLISAEPVMRTIAKKKSDKQIRLYTINAGHPPRS